MRGLNKVFLLGHLGKDPIITYTPTGLCVAKISFATTEGLKQNGKWENRTTWHKVTAFGNLAELVDSELSKGSPVFIEGRLSYGQYEKEGIKIKTINIVVHSLRFLGRVEQEVQPSEVEQDTDAHLSDEDLPF